MRLCGRIPPMAATQEDGRFSRPNIRTVYLPWTPQDTAAALTLQSQGKLARLYPHEEFSPAMELAIHPNNSGRIIVNIPGYNGAIDGYEDKHKKLAILMQQENLGAVLRIANRANDYPRMLGSLKRAIEYGLEHAEEICGSDNPEVCLIGTSAGGGAISAVSSEYPNVKGLLLMAPGDNPDRRIVRRGLSRFTGELYIVIGADDNIVGPGAGQIFYDMAINASHKEEPFIIPACDHNFKGEKNGRIMSEAPFYAFAKGDKPAFPDPTGGVKLYD